MLKKPFIFTDPLEAYKGSYFSETLVWESNAVAVNLTGYTFQGKFRDGYGGSVIKEITTSNGGIVVTALEGKVELILQIADTDLFEVPLLQTKLTDIPYRDYTFDIDAIPPDTTKRFQFAKGVLRVYAENTR